MRSYGKCKCSCYCHLATIICKWLPLYNGCNTLEESKQTRTIRWHTSAIIILFLLIQGGQSPTILGSQSTYVLVVSQLAWQIGLLRLHWQRVLRVYTCIDFCHSSLNVTGTLKKSSFLMHGKEGTVVVRAHSEYILSSAHSRCTVL